LTHNIASLYGTQIAAYLFPLLAVPYLARVLGVYTWGLVAFAQAFGAYVYLLVDFGFNLSATRDVSRHREDRNRLSDVLAGVLGAKSVLALLCIVATFALQHWVRQFRENPLLLWSAIVMGIAQAYSMIWYYQGLERMKTSSAIDIASKAAGLLGIFLLVHSPAHAWRVLGIQAIASLAGTGVLMVLAYREVPFRLPSARGTWQTMRMGGSTFLLRSAVSLYTTANVIIVGFFASPVAVGYYSGAEKLTRGFLSLMGPVSLSLYPRLTHLIKHAQAQAVRLARLSFIFMGVCGTALAVLLWLAAPLVVRVILGPKFLPAVPVVRILCVLLPAVATSNVIGIQWMLPCGLDKECNRIVLGAGVLNCILACALAPHLGAIGVSIAVAVTEVCVTGGLYVLLTRRKMNPFRMTKSLEEVVFSIRLNQVQP
jgi:PST family polysaccharide transporter